MHKYIIYTYIHTCIHTRSDSSGKIVKSSYRHGEVLDLEQWYFAKKIVQREYFEVDA